ncbi:hypothetical protein [Alkalicoccobacillus porphyridii]|uniref:DUF4306 domain-containing protein n=1 Tax=Alkalicoccobacillus porphyridii TaxID=2597270 RepID=A0A553ZW85_9BACI|nr:hypothetical protein [Alkalicoccobacillus porphyridii]TSB45731.1 hypothetical protein FN960_14685 [Alkalicoccobacillus porphyridii]
MSIKKMFFISIGLALLSVFVFPPFEEITEEGVTYSYGAPIEFMIYQSFEGEEPTYWQLITFDRTYMHIFLFINCVTAIFVILLFIKLLDEKRRKRKVSAREEEQ